MPEVNIQSSGESDFIQVVKVGKIQFTKDASSVSESGVATHNLGYVPGVIAFIKLNDTDEKRPLPWTFPEPFDASTDGHGRVTIHAYVDTVTNSDITFVFMTPEDTFFYAEAYPVTITYYLLRLPILN